MEGTFILKPCVENPIKINLRTTTLESSIHPLKKIIRDRLVDRTPQRSTTSTLQGHIFEEVCMSTLISRNAGEKMSDFHLKRLNSEAMSWLEEGKSKKDLAFLKYKLENYLIVDIAEAYYYTKNKDNELKPNMVSCQNSLSRYIEAGKYLIELTGTSDLLGWDEPETFLTCMRDIKYYASAFGDSDGLDHDTYTLNNRKGSRLGHNIQWYVYPRLLQGDLVNGQQDEEGYLYNFYYDVYSKNKNAPSKTKPENHLKREVLKCSVDLNLAGLQIKQDLTDYLVLCHKTGITPGEKVSAELQDELRAKEANE